MAVMISKDGEDLALDCSCGCEEGIRIKVNKFHDDTYFVLSYTNGNFYRGQNENFFSIFRKKLKKIWCIIRNKDYVYSEICMTKSDFEEFRTFISEIK